MLCLASSDDGEAHWFLDEGILSPSSFSQARLSLVDLYNQWDSFVRDFDLPAATARLTSVGNIAYRYLPPKFTPVRALPTLKQQLNAQNLRDGVTVSFKPRIKRAKKKQGSTAPARRYRSGCKFENAHDAVNDAFVTLAAWFQILVDTAIQQGYIKDNDTAVENFPQPFRIVSVDCEGCCMQPGLKKKPNRTQHTTAPGNSVSWSYALPIL
jgi:hypothetical protein